MSNGDGQGEDTGGLHRFAGPFPLAPPVDPGGYSIYIEWQRNLCQLTGMSDSPYLKLDEPTLKQSVLLRSAGGPSQPAFQNWVRRAPQPLTLSLHFVDGKRRFTIEDALRVATAVLLTEKVAVPISAIDPVAEDVVARARAIVDQTQLPPFAPLQLYGGRWSKISFVRAYAIEGEELSAVFGAASMDQIAPKEFERLPEALIWFKIDELIVAVLSRLGWSVAAESLDAKAHRARAAELEAHLKANAALEAGDDD